MAMQVNNKHQDKMSDIYVYVKNKTTQCSIDLLYRYPRSKSTAVYRLRKTKEFLRVCFLYNQLSFANTIWLIWCGVIKPN